MEGERNNKGTRWSCPAWIATDLMNVIGRAEDLDSEGFFIRCPYLETAGTHVRATLNVAEGHFVSVDAVVAWVRSEGGDRARSGMGIAVSKTPAWNCLVALITLGNRGAWPAPVGAP